MQDTTKEKIGGKAYIVIGYTGMGKSTFIKNILKDIDPSMWFVYDVNGEYHFQPNGDPEPLPDLKDFLLKCKASRRKIIVFEDATAFFSNRGRDDLMVKLLVGKRHSENIYFLLFHSVRACPHYILEMCNALYLFNTNDQRELVEKKYPSLLPAYDKVQGKKYVYEKLQLA